MVAGCLPIERTVHAEPACLPPVCLFRPLGTALPKSPFLSFHAMPYRMKKAVPVSGRSHGGGSRQLAGRPPNCLEFSWRILGVAQAGSLIPPMPRVHNAHGVGPSPSRPAGRHAGLTPSACPCPFPRRRENVPPVLSPPAQEESGGLLLPSMGMLPSQAAAQLPFQNQPGCMLKAEHTGRKVPPGRRKSCPVESREKSPRQCWESPSPPEGISTAQNVGYGAGRLGRHMVASQGRKGKKLGNFLPNGGVRGCLTEGIPPKQGRIRQRAQAGEPHRLEQVRLHPPPKAWYSPPTIHTNVGHIRQGHGHGQ